MELERKAFAVDGLKALGKDDPPGSFEAIVAVFGNIDDYGDRIVKGAFERTLKERGMPPVVWSHMWSTVPIGATMAAEEIDEGLYIKGQLLVEDHEVARQAYAAMMLKGGDGRPALREFSFAFDVRESASVTEDGDEIRELRDLELYEVGPTLLGANPATRLVGVKDLREALHQERAGSGPQNDPVEKAGSDAARQLRAMALGARHL